MAKPDKVQAKGETVTPVEGTEALKPIFRLAQHGVEQEEESPATFEDAIVEEEQLAAMSHSAGWKIVKRTKRKMLEGLEDLNNKAMTGGASLEEIGQNTVVISLTRGIVNQIFDIVEDAKESVRKNKRKSKGE